MPKDKWAKIVILSVELDEATCNSVFQTKTDHEDDYDDANKFLFRASLAEQGFREQTAELPDQKKATLELGRDTELKLETDLLWTIEVNYASPDGSVRETLPLRCELELPKIESNWRFWRKLVWVKAGEIEHALPYPDSKKTVVVNAGNYKVTLAVEPTRRHVWQRGPVKELHAVRGVREGTGHAVHAAPAPRVVRVASYRVAIEYTAVEDEDDIDRRLATLKQRIKHAYEKMTSLDSGEPSALYVFITPEYYFRYNAWDAENTTYPQAQMWRIVRELSTYSKDYNNLLIVPGTVHWNTPEAVKREVIAAKKAEAESGDPSMVTELRNAQVVYNTVPVVMNNRFVHFYHKRYDANELRLAERETKAFALSRPGPAKTSGVEESETPPVQKTTESSDTSTNSLGLFQANGINFGIEVCRDHLQGTLLRECGGRGNCDVHLVPSAGVRRPRLASVVARAGGYFVRCDGFPVKTKTTRENPTELPPWWKMPGRAQKLEKLFESDVKRVTSLDPLAWESVDPELIEADKCLGYFKLELPTAFD